MIKAELTIEMLSEWIVGGGNVPESPADRVQIRNHNAVPYLPGRSLRGLLRDALEQAKGFEPFATASTVADLFGSSGTEGVLRIGDGRLPAAFETIGEHPSERSALFTTYVARTSIDRSTGGAKDKSLRMTEVGIPGLYFVAEVEVPHEESLAHLATAAALVRTLGADRYRGLGRCRMQLLRAGVAVQRWSPVQTSER